jgi:hypothetical protein
MQHRKLNITREQLQDKLTTSRIQQGLLPVKTVKLPDLPDLPSDEDIFPTEPFSDAKLPPARSILLTFLYIYLVDNANSAPTLTRKSKTSVILKETSSKVASSTPHRYGAC